MSEADAAGTAMEYFVFCEVFDREACQGFDAPAVKRLLFEAEHLDPTTDKAGGFESYARRERLPGMGNTNVIKIKPSILEGSE